MISNTSPDSREDNAQYDPEDNPGSETTVPTTDEGDTPLDERSRMTSQQADSEVRSGAAPEAPGAAPKVIGAPNQGTDSR